MRHRRLTLVFLCLCALWGRSPARAHGPAAAVLSVLPPPDSPADARDGVDGEVALQTSLGLVVGSASAGFDYVCPAHWGGNPTALVSRFGANRFAVVSGGRVFVSNDGGCGFDPLGLPEGHSAYAVRDDGDGALLLTRTPDGSAVLRVESGSVVTLGAVPNGAIADDIARFDGGLLVSSARPVPVLLFAAADSESSVAGAESFEAPVADAARMSIRAVHGSSAWLEVALHGGVMLAQLRRQRTGVDWEPVVEVAGEILGPVVVDRRVVWVRDGVVFARGVDAVDGSPATELGPVDYTCLVQEGGQLLACVLPPAGMPTAPALLELDAADPAVAEGRTLFSFEMVGPPREECLGPNPDTCRADWLHYGGEAGLLAAADDGAPEPHEATHSHPTDSTASGCNIGRDRSNPRFSALTALAALSVLAAWRRGQPRRRRRAASCPIDVGHCRP